VCAVSILHGGTATADPPRPFTACWLHWIAVPTGDQAGVMDVLGLADPEPVGFGGAEEFVDLDSHRDLPADDRGRVRVYVSPELDGWTFVIGRWCSPADPERTEDVARLCTALSARYGRAHAFYYGARGDGSAWLITENGTVLRRYCETGDPEDALLTLGDPLPYEQARRAELDLPPVWDEATESEDDEEEWAWATYDMAPDLAASLSLCPRDILPTTPCCGTGVLAHTPPPAPLPDPA
jgi:hypothetical protein